MIDKFIEIIDFDESEIILKTKYSWSYVLNANFKLLKNYSLPLNSISIKKLEIIDIDCGMFGCIPNDKGLVNKLRYYQAEDLERLKGMKSSGIFSEMRTGKTAISLSLFISSNIPNLVIVCPSILQRKWQIESEDWVKKPCFIISYLSKEEKRDIYKKIFSKNGWIIVLSKDSIKTSVNFFLESQIEFYLILDEGHFLRNFDSIQSKNLFKMSLITEYKNILTGTPIVNKASDIFGILKFLQPQKYNNYWKFVNKYFILKNSVFNFGGKKIRRKEVGGFKGDLEKRELKKIISDISVRRRQKDVLDWIPKVIFQKEFLRMDEEQETLYKKFSSKKIVSLYQLDKLKTITLYPKIIGSKTNGVKFNYLIDFCLENHSKKIIIFSLRSNTFLIPLYKSLIQQKNDKGEKKEIKVSMLVGETTKAEREKCINHFQNGDINIILCNIKVAGVGIDLSSADTIIFSDRSYSPAENEQAESRFIPSIKKREIIKKVIDLVCLNSIDEKILKILENKKNVSDIIKNDPKIFE